MVKPSSKSKSSGGSGSRGQKRQKKPEGGEDEVIAELERRVVDEAPPRGFAPDLKQTVAFRALPLSEPTLRGLDGAKPQPFTTMTAIQNACIPHALVGRDVLGAAKTGSGKTLAFLIPTLELLYRSRYTPVDGPGAIVLTPTRELAVQIFQVLRQVGRHHTFTVGLLIGGKKDFDLEQQQVGTTNILIATPGRLLQHLEQTPYFDVSSLKMLVLDEADRILDMGFRDQLVKILEYIPVGEDRQTLLFSATQTKDVSHLATLSLRSNNTEYLGVHDKSKTSTPESLQQSYVVVPLDHKLNAIYSFVRSHLKSKSILFMASCAQVRFAWELFCSLRPGIPIMALHGKLSQEKRTRVYFDFVQRPHAVLFATDIAARGLDFQKVDWVVQVDAPEDRDQYIHRAGRTARYKSGGKSLLLLTPAEEKGGFVSLLQGGGGSGGSKIPLKKLSINPNKTAIVTQRAASLVASNFKLNQLAKKAYRSYVRSVYLMPNKDVFDAKDLPVDEFSQSLGLASTPKLSFLKKSGGSTEEDRTKVRERKNVNHKLQRLKEQIKAEKLAKKLKRMGKSDAEVEEATRQFLSGKNKKVDEGGDVAQNEVKGGDGSGDDDGDDDDDEEEEVIVSKRVRAWDDPDDGDGDGGPLPDAGLDAVSKSRHPKKIRIDVSNSATNKRVRYDDDGNELDDSEVLPALAKAASRDDDDEQKVSLEQATDDYVQKVRERLQQNHEQDQLEERERIRNKHKKRRLKEKGEREPEAETGEAGGVTVTLGGDERDDEHAGDGSTSGSSSSSSSSSASSSSPSSSSSEEDGSSSPADDNVSVDLKAQEEMALSLIRGT